MAATRRPWLPLYERMYYTGYRGIIQIRGMNLAPKREVQHFSTEFHKRFDRTQRKTASRAAIPCS